MSSARPIRESHFFHNHCVVWFVVIDKDADGAGHQGEGESGHDAAVRHSIFQITDSSAEDIEQQRHHSQGRNAGAGCHNNAGMQSEKNESKLE